MIRRRVSDMKECFARDRDHMLLANFESVRGFETEREALHPRELVRSNGSGAALEYFTAGIKNVVYFLRIRQISLRRKRAFHEVSGVRGNVQPREKGICTVSLIGRASDS